MKLKDNINKTTFFQFIRFGIIGGMNTLIDFVIFEILHFLTPIPIEIIQVISYSIAAVNSYIFNKNWTFKDKSKSNTPLMTRFAVLTLVCLGISVLLINQFTKYIFISSNEKLNTAFNKCLVTGIVILINFITNKLWVFNKESAKGDLQK